MKKREEILAKAEEFASAPADSVEGEAYWILTTLAGENEADMFSADGAFDFIYSLEKDEEGSAAAEAASIVAEFLNK
jgi:hypothetical protein